MIEPGAVAFDAAGLVPAVVQDATTGRVLMLAYMNAAALAATLDTGQVHFWSRSRAELWRKGATSGNTLELVDLAVDCDGDALLVKARPTGPACHTGAVSCFSPAESGQGFAQLEGLWGTIASRARERPEGSYTTRLLDGGVDLVARKVLEEAGEVLLAAKDQAAATDDEGSRKLAGRVAEEAADLVYHLLVLLAERDVEPRHVIDVLADRTGERG